MNNKGDIGKESKHRSHQIQTKETRFSLDLGLYGIQGGLNGQAEVLSVGKLEDITDADQGGLAGEEGHGNLEES